MITSQSKFKKSLMPKLLFIRVTEMGKILFVKMNFAKYQRSSRFFDKI